jgi:hypothetical protein
MPAIAAPYGLRPLRLSSGAPFSGALQKYRIASLAAGMFRGSPVRLSSGNLVPVTDGVFGSSPRDMYVGVLNGVEYRDAAGNMVYANSFPNGLAATEAFGFVIHDRDVIFQIQVQASGFDALANIGARYEISQHASGNATTGNSTARLNTAAGAGDTKPFVLLGLAAKPDNPNATGFVDVEVRINTGIHINER